MEHYKKRTIRRILLNEGEDRDTVTRFLQYLDREEKEPDSLDEALYMYKEFKLI